MDRTWKCRPYVFYCLQNILDNYLETTFLWNHPSLRIWQYWLWSFLAGGMKLERFFLRINILKEHYWILRIGLIKPQKFSKIRVLKINYFHPPIHPTNEYWNFGIISMRKMICSSDIVFCCIVAWIQPDISGCQQDFLVVWRWNQLRTF